MRSKFLALVLLIGGAAWTVSAEDLTPRQELDRAEKLFADGHRFTAEESVALNDLEQKLAATGDGDLAADLRLLRQGAAAQAQAAEARDQAAANRDQEASDWRQRERLEQNRALWRTTRDWGLVSFTASTLTLVGLAAIVEIDDNRLKNGYFTDWSSRQDLLDKARWGVAWAAGASLLSLFPLLWGEARQ